MAAFVAALLLSSPVIAADLLDALSSIEEAHAALCPGVTGGAGGAEAGGLAGRIEALAARLPAAPLPDATTGPSAVDAVNRLLFQDLALRPSADLKDPCNLLPSRVLERRQGYCVGIAAVYLLLAERLGLPVQAVAAPSHLFLRYDDGTVRRNIETFDGGAPTEDAAYARQHRIPERALRRGVFLRGLTVPEFVAQVRNNLGVIYSGRREYGKAEAQYRRALALLPEFPAALYNLGNDRLALRDHPGAIRHFTRALRLNPADVWALNNRGIAHRDSGKTRRARRDFLEALSIDPGFETARRNLLDLERGPAQPATAPGG